MFVLQMLLEFHFQKDKKKKKMQLYIFLILLMIFGAEILYKMRPFLCDFETLWV